MQMLWLHISYTVLVLVCTIWGFTHTSNLIAWNITCTDFSTVFLDPWTCDSSAPPPSPVCFPMPCELCQWCRWTGGSVGSQCKNVKAALQAYLCHFYKPSLPPSFSLCSSGYALLHVTREDTWKWIQLQIWHLVARMPALRGKLWRCVCTLSPCSRLEEWHENTLVQTHI